MDPKLPRKPRISRTSKSLSDHVATHGVDSPDEVKDLIRTAATSAPDGEKYGAVAEVRELRDNTTIVQQLHVKLIARASVALAWLTSNLGLNQTDTVNRALQVYAFLEKERAADGEILIRRQDGSLHIVHIL